MTSISVQILPCKIDIAIDQIGTALEFFKVNGIRWQSGSPAEEEPPLPLTDRDKGLLDYIKEHPGVSTQDLMDQYSSIPKGSVSATISRLYQRALIVRTGSLTRVDPYRYYLPGTAPKPAHAKLRAEISP